MSVKSEVILSVLGCELFNQFLKGSQFLSVDQVELLEDKNRHMHFHCKSA